MHLHAKKSLGQHFLIDPKAHKRIVGSLAPKAADVVIEIGPGTGLLTRELLASPLKKLIAFELDARAIPELRAMFENEGSRFVLEEQDFLESDLGAIAEREERKIRVVGNIPYYITSPILFKLIDERAVVRDALLLLQKEVAERLTAKPRTKAYGIPTVLANFFGEVTYLFKILAGAFRPAPNVDSALVHIDFERDYFTRAGIPKPADFDEAAFRKLVRGLFAMRRKTIRNNLKAIAPTGEIERIEASAISPFLNARAEELSIEDFLKLHAALLLTS
ncbi:MAG TPA: 16S rRNA (adenine(1518)-N(6)/adenine(1519)-N(6))-dimethyltransferase RsmA [Candidatus Kapabacteria bacterium]|nr:16S rRNA (adenine(1518)-N(6)/adenine(1519)-N(6))-dimethyltransferase RsmA [Candidatus Kapabacteria bacterium]